MFEDSVVPSLSRRPNFEQNFVRDVASMITQIRKIDYVVLNAGVLNYPNVSAALILLHVHRY